MEAGSSLPLHSPSESDHPPLLESAMQATECLSPRSLAATQGTDWVERARLSPRLAPQDINGQGFAVFPQSHSQGFGFTGKRDFQNP